MSSFLTIHNNDKGPAFSTFDTIQAAKNHLQHLLCSHQVTASDTLAIVRSSDDSIVYFRQRNNTLARLNAALGQHETNVSYSLPSVFQLVKEQVTFAFSTLTTAMSRL